VDVISIIYPINPINDLTLDELRKNFLGEITRWNEVGGEDTAIKRIPESN
jgi:phosphate transport system substrate-binding protein